MVFLKESQNMYSPVASESLNCPLCLLVASKVTGFFACYLKFSVIRTLQDSLCATLSCQFSADLEGTRSES